MEPFPDFLYQCKRTLHASVATSACRHSDQTIGALCNRLLCKEVVDHIVQNNSTPAMHRIIDIGACAERGDDNRHFVAGADLHVLVQPVVALVYDLIDRERRSRAIRVRAVVSDQRFRDLGQPVVELFRRASVECWHRADHTCLALFDHQLGAAHDEEW